MPTSTRKLVGEPQPPGTVAVTRGLEPQQLVVSLLRQWLAGFGAVPGRQAASRIGNGFANWLENCWEN